MRKTFIILSIIFLVGCTQGKDSQSSSSTEGNKEGTEKNEEKENLIETSGFVEKLSTKQLTIRELDNQKSLIIFDISKVDPNVISTIKTNQKVKVTHHIELAYSNPPKGNATNIEILE